MKKRFLALMAVAVTLGVLAPLVVLASTASACAGLSPGYWKNHQTEWNDYSTGDSFVGVFGLNDPVYRAYLPDGYVFPATLLDALKSKGGQWNALNRQAVAALLNSTSGIDSWDNPPYDYECIKGWVQHAYRYNDWEAVKDMIEGMNSL